MATKTNNEQVALENEQVTPENEQVTPADEKVDLYIEPGYANDDPNEYIGVNGMNFVLPKGKTSKVPPYVKAEYERARRAKAIQRENSDKLHEKANQPI